MPAQAIFDGVIDNALKVFRLAASEKQATFARLKELEKELVGKLANEALTNADAKKIDKFLKETSKIIEENYKQLQLEFEGFGTATYVANSLVNDINGALGIAAMQMPSADYLAAVASDVLIMGAPASAWWQGQAADTALKFAQQVRQGLTSGETNQQIISRIVGKGGEPGVMGVARRHAAALVQTSVQSVANGARRATFEANPDVIKGLKQVSTLDSHTSLVCISYSGCEWNLDYEPIGENQKPFNGGTPRHFNCRSVEIPLTKTFAELGFKNVKEPGAGQRASELGPIDANTSFDDFLKRRGKAYQDEMLGEGRADLWREGKITLRDLVSAEGRPLSLGELERLAHKRDVAGFSGADYMKKFDKADVTPDSILDSFPADTRAKIADTKARLAKLTATNELHGKDGVYTQERLDLHDKILYEGVQGFDPETSGTKFYPGILNEDAVAKASVAPTQQPVFTILGGRGGSGKSAFDGRKFPEAKVYDADRAIVFDSDHIKHMLPEFAGFNANQVYQESSDILARALLEAKGLRLNVVLDGTLKSPALDKIKEYKEAGFRTEAHYMHLPRQEAAKRAVSRYLEPTGRYVPAEIIIGNIKNEANFDELRKFVDDWSFRDNNVAKGNAPKLVARKFK